MSKSNNLTDFLTDVAGAIRTKKGYPSTQKINPQNFSSEIASIVSSPKLQSKTVNPASYKQVVKPSSGYDGLSQVTVNAANLIEEMILTDGDDIGMDFDTMYAIQATDAAGVVSTRFTMSYLAFGNTRKYIALGYGILFFFADSKSKRFIAVTVPTFNGTQATIIQDSVVDLESVRFSTDSTAYVHIFAANNLITYK